MSVPKKNSIIFKAFCDETRLKVLDMLREGEKCACSLLSELDITQPTLSHHMKILCDSGIVQCRRAGRWTYYSINTERVAYAKQYIEGLAENK